MARLDELLVLSLFPGIDLFGKAFEKEGFCSIVRGPDILYASDIVEWKPVKNKFDIIIGGPPCKPHSRAALGTSNEQDLIPEFERCVFQARPICFVMENVIEAPIPRIHGYATHDFVIDSWEYGSKQRRVRRFTFGYLSNGELRSFPFVPESPLPEHMRIKDPMPTVLASEGKYSKHTASRKIGRKLSVEEMCELQGLPELAKAWCFETRGRNRRKVYRKEYEYELIGNGVEFLAGSVIARTVRNGLHELGVLCND